jgi:hypothetical protein
VHPKCSASRPVVSVSLFHARGVFSFAGCFVRRCVTSRRCAHSAGVKHLVGALRAYRVGVKRSGGVICADGVRGFTHQRGFTLLTPRGVPLSSRPSSRKHTRIRCVMLQEKFHREMKTCCLDKERKERLYILRLSKPSRAFHRSTQISTLQRNLKPKFSTN